MNAAAIHSGVLMVRKTMPILLIISAADPATNIFLIPISSYSFPANGLTTAVAREPGRVTRPETTAEQSITSWTYSGIITEDPIITRYSTILAITLTV